MPKRIPLSTIVVHRDGKRVEPPIGQAFDFTADEVEEINALEKTLADQGNSQLLFRKVINEDADVIAQSKVKTEQTGTDYDALTVDKLKALATERNVDLGGATLKADIIAKLKAEDEGL